MKNTVAEYTLRAEAGHCYLLFIVFQGSHHSIITFENF